MLTSFDPISDIKHQESTMLNHLNHNIAAVQYFILSFIALLLIIYITIIIIITLNSLSQFLYMDR